MKKITAYVDALVALKDKRGFTLVEVLVALLVLGILFVPVSNGFLQSVHINQHLQQRVLAVRNTQTAMEVTLALLSTLDVLEGERPENVDRDKPEQAIGLEQQISSLFADFGASGLTSGLMEADTAVAITPLNEHSPFVIVTTTNQFTLTTLVLPGAAPWLTPKVYQVVTP